MTDMNRVEMCAKCGDPCLSGEIDNHAPRIRWGERINGVPICDPCFNRDPRPPQPTTPMGEVTR